MLSKESEEGKTVHDDREQGVQKREIWVRFEYEVEAIRVQYTSAVGTSPENWSVQQARQSRGCEHAVYI